MILKLLSVNLPKVLVIVDYISLRFYPILTSVILYRVDILSSLLISPSECLLFKLLSSFLHLYNITNLLVNSELKKKLSNLIWSTCATLVKSTIILCLYLTNSYKYLLFNSPSQNILHQIHVTSLLKIPMAL